MWLEDLRLRVDLDVLVLDRELRSVHLDFLISWVLDDDLVGDTFANRTRQLDRLDLSVVLNCDLEGVEEVLARVLRHKRALELVNSGSEGQEVELVVPLRSAALLA